MPKKHTKPSKPATAGTVDPTQAKAAFDDLETTIDAISADRLVSVRVDPQMAATHAFGISERDRAAERAAAFEKLVKASVIDAKPNDRLAKSALAVWYARQQQMRIASQGDGLVPASVAGAADEIKRRMLKVVAHAFEDHPTYGPEITAIRAGTGYQDTANDLQQLADLYDVPEVKEVVEKDPSHYRDTDTASARKSAAQIFKALGYESTDATEWALKVQRAYTYLDETYTEHCRAGALLFFRSEDVDVTYPMSLVSVVRAPRGRTEQPTPAGDPKPAAAPSTPAA